VATLVLHKRLLKEDIKKTLKLLCFGAQISKIYLMGALKPPLDLALSRMLIRN